MSWRTLPSNTAENGVDPSWTWSESTIAIYCWQTAGRTTKQNLNPSWLWIYGSPSKAVLMFCSHSDCLWVSVTQHFSVLGMLRKERKKHWPDDRYTRLAELAKHRIFFSNTNLWTCVSVTWSGFGYCKSWLASLFSKYFLILFAVPDCFYIFPPWVWFMGVVRNLSGMQMQKKSHLFFVPPLCHHSLAF